MYTLKHRVAWIVVVMACLPLLCSCENQDIPEPARPDVPEGMVEVRPLLPGMHSVLPRVVPGDRTAATRTYPSNEETAGDLVKNPLLRLPKGSTLWLIAQSGTEGAMKYEKRAYVVYNPEDDASMSYLVPCTVNDYGEVLSMEGAPFYLKDGESYNFYAISPARKLDEEMLAQGKIGFQVKNGEYFYANDSRYASTEPKTITVHSDNEEAVQEIRLNPMINQTAELKFQIRRGDYVHDLNIQPSGIQISGLQNDSVTVTNPKGIIWQMSLAADEEPFTLQHGNKSGTFTSYDYTLDTGGQVNISVPVIPMYSISKPVIVVFRLKINGVPTSYEMMLNEKDFKAGYSYGYRGKVSIEEGVSVITWQYVSWEHDVIFPFDTY